MPTLTWLGKKAVINHDRDVPFHLLQEVPELSFGDKDSGNLIVQGDNLIALKSLLPYYAGKVKCIYIDPPYNTGNEGWVYNDNVNDPEIKAWINNVVGKEAEDLSRHDKWLCMMYPRLKLLQRFLTKDGCIIISINHIELENLVVICREIFSSSQINIITVQTSGGKPSGGFNFVHEYLVFISPLDFESNSLDFCGGNARTPFEGLTLSTFDKTQRPNQVYPILIDKNGHFAGTGKSLQEQINDGTYTGEKSDFNYDYSIAPEGMTALWPITNKGKQCVWRQISSRLKKDWEQGFIKISLNANSNSNVNNKYSIQYLPSGVIKKIKNGELAVLGKEDGVPTLKFGKNQTVGGQIPTIWSEKEFFTVNGTQLLKRIFPEKDKVFDYPKPLQLVLNIIRAVTNDNDIILDSFAGSGTTGHATLELNSEIGGKRQFILVEMSDYANNVTAERNRRVIMGYDGEEGLGGGFRYYKLGCPLFDEYGNVFGEVKFADLAKHVYFSETGSPLPDDTNLSTPLIGVCNGRAIYLLYNGILKDKNPKHGNVLTREVLACLPKFDGPKVVYGTGCRLAPMTLRVAQIDFKQIPYELKR